MNHTKGRTYEKIAGEYLKKQGYEILEYNYRSRYSEIDIIAKDGACIVFCEVKYRKGKDKLSPFEAVTLQKQKRISHAALYYLTIHNSLNHTSRFDVIGCNDSEIIHIKNAFNFMGA